MFTEAEYREIAARENVDVAMIKALAEVESSGQTQLSPTDPRPPILFEGQWFHHFTGGKYDEDHPGISYPSWDMTKYVGGAGEYDRLAEAEALDHEAALKSTSWGPFQIMGFNFKEAGYSSVDEMVDHIGEAGNAGEIKSLEGFLEHSGVIHALQIHDFRTVAAIYNGPGQVDEYARRLDAAYSHYKDGGEPRTVIQLGDRGRDVVALQKFLGVDADGEFGPKTLEAVVAFQTKHGLAPDGKVGHHTMETIRNQIKNPNQPSAEDEGGAAAPSFVKPLPGAHVDLMRGDVGDQVTLLQKRLDVEETGDFDGATEEAVKEFQRDHGLTDTGIVDEATDAAIVAAMVPKSKGKKR